LCSPGITCSGLLTPVHGTQAGTIGEQDDLLKNNQGNPADNQDEDCEENGPQEEGALVPILRAQLEAPLQELLHSELYPAAEGIHQVRRVFEDGSSFVPSIQVQQHCRHSGLCTYWYIHCVSCMIMPLNTCDLLLLRCQGDSSISCRFRHRTDALYRSEVKNKKLRRPWDTCID